MTPPRPRGADVARCTTCREWMHGAFHRCSPAFLVWRADEDESEARRVHAFDADDAATTWAQEYDSDGEYPIVQGEVVEVHVRDGDGTLTRWSVSGEYDPSYSARDLGPAATTMPPAPDREVGPREPVVGVRVALTGDTAVGSVTAVRRGRLGNIDEIEVRWDGFGLKSHRWNAADFVVLP